MQAHSGLEVMARRECLRLLATKVVGRLGFLVGDQPMVLPVNYAVRGEEVVFRTGEGAKLAGVALGKVAFEVDDVDADTGHGWSVVVQGVAEEITEVDDWFAASLRDAPRTWVPAADHYVRIRPTAISGRRLPPAVA